MLQTALALPWESRKQHHHELSLKPAGRYRLEKGVPLRHWDLAAGIGTSVLSTLRGGFTYLPGGYYYTCEVNDVARGVIRANLEEIGAEYPSRAPKAAVFNEFDSVLPNDLFDLARGVRDLLKALPTEQLPNYISSSVPCTETSTAGLGGAGNTEKGKLYLCVITVIWAVELEYRERGLSEPGRASVGWLYETSPTTDGRDSIKDFRSQMEVLLGEPTEVDQARTGGTSRRKTELYSNLGEEGSWKDMGSRFSRLPEIPIEDLLRKGEVLQVWDERFHGKAEWPNVNGRTLQVYPKMVRSLGSHAFRLQPIRRTLGGRPQCRYPMGISLRTTPGKPPEFLIPSPQQAERSLGYRADYTLMACQRGGHPVRLGADDRRGLLGDVFGMHVHSAVLVEASSARATPPLNALEPGSEPERGTAQQSPAQPRQGSEPEEQAWEQTHYPAECLLGEQLAAFDMKGVKAPARSERLPPIATAVPAAWPIGSPQDLWARRNLAKALGWMEARRNDVTIPEATLSASELKSYIQENLIHDDARFEPGYIHKFRNIWKEYLHATLGEKTFDTSKKIRTVWRLLQKGLEGQWASPDRPASEKHPLHEQRRASVKRMMTLMMTKEEAEAKLCEPSPAQVRLPNLASCFETTVFHDGTSVNHREFCDEQIFSYIKLKICSKWPWPEGRAPKCVLPLGVAVRDLEKKLRLIFDARYLNLWMKYIGFSYETMIDILNMAVEGGWATVSDYKSGYSHISTPDLTEYMSFSWNGEYYYFTCCPFGVAVACRIFTEINEVMLRPLRLEGIRISIYIDDRISISETEYKSKVDSLIQYAIVGCMGWFINSVKSLFSGEQLVKFTGLLLDFERCTITVPEKKLGFILLQIDRALADIPAVSVKDIQSIAGRVGSARLAIRLAPLLCWRLHKEAPSLVRAIGGGSEEAAEELTRILDFIKVHVCECNGSTFWQQPTGMVVAGDAGEMGSGSHLVWPRDLGVPPMQTSFTEEEMRQIDDHEYYSTLREVANVLETLKWVTESAHLLTPAREGAILYLTDSQSTHDAIMGMSTKKRKVYDLVWEVWALVRWFGLGLVVRWCSRAHPLLKTADDQTREADESALGLKEKYFDRTLAAFGILKEQIELDPFSQKEFAKAARWYSQYSAPGSAGVDGFTLPWTNDDGSKAFCFVHGPYSMMGKVLKKVAYEKVDCILIAPAWPQYWVAMLQSLPIVATAEITGDAVPGRRGARENIYVRGSRASEETIASSVHWKTSAYLVRYSVRVTKPVAVKEGTERMDVWPSFEGPL